MTDRIRIEFDAHVAMVTLDRAAKRNAVDEAMFEAIIETADRLRDDKSLRCVVLTGEGAHFCAGIDISVFQGAGIAGTAGDRMAPRPGSTANFFQAAALAWRELPVPVIAALRGTVFGAGLQIAAGADLRVAAPDVALSIMEVRWGIIPDMGVTTTLRHLVREDRLRELAYSGRVVDGATALEAGLVTELAADPLARAQEIAVSIAEKSPDAIRAMKKLFNESLTGDPAVALRLEADLQSQLMGGANQREAALANLEKREPDFSDPE